MIMIKQGRIVKVNAISSVGKNVAEPILGRVVNIAQYSSMIPASFF